ncbi:MAG: cellulase family glycosylhydrolase [Lachnospiraceae bacterium]|nr:cellulase family glycosylhydrolase [Lachnospiraceae bacterium]
MAVVIIGLTIALIKANSKNKKNTDDPTPTPNSVSEVTPTEAPNGTPTEAGTPTPGGEGKDTPTPTGAVTGTPEPTEAGKGTPTPTEAGKGTPTPTASPTPKPEEIEGYLVEYSAGNTWNDGGVTMMNLEFGVRNNAKEAISGGWKLVVTIEGLAKADGWNGTFSVQGDTLTITNANYNGDIAIGATQVVGCNLGIKKDELKVTKATLNGVACTVRAGVVDQNRQNQGGNGGNGGNGNGGEDVDVEEMLKRSKDAVQGDDWLHTDGTKILDKDGREVWLTGVNWFGYNTGTNLFDGLWNSKLEPTVKAIADHGFNLIRVPISAELINQWADGVYPTANYNHAYNEALNSMNSLEIFEYFLKLAEANGIKVMPDIHSAETNAAGHNVNLWYTQKVTEEDWLKALEWMAERYKDNDTIIAYDLKNEPHGKPYEKDNAAIWNDSKQQNNWKYAAEKAAARILAVNPNVLILVEGTEIFPKNLETNADFHSTDEKDYDFNWWGGNLRGVKEYPIDLGKYQDKLVYSPHDYGPTVYQQPWFKGSFDYDSLMKDCWHDNWFFIYEDETAPLLIGEWGGFMTEPNISWMKLMRQLIKTYHLNHTFWCLNANSGDTGGLLLDDFTTWDSAKYEFVKEVLWQENGKFVGLDHAIPLGVNGIKLSDSKGLK